MCGFIIMRNNALPSWLRHLPCILCYLQPKASSRRHARPLDFPSYGIQLDTTVSTQAANKLRTLIVMTSLREYQTIFLYLRFFSCIAFGLQPLGQVLTYPEERAAEKRPTRTCPQSTETTCDSVSFRAPSPIQHLAELNKCCADGWTDEQKSKPFPMLCYKPTSFTGTIKFHKPYPCSLTNSP